MATLVLGSPPPELQALLARRHEAGVDRLDEVWLGVRHLVPAPSLEHARVCTELAVVLGSPATARGLVAAMSAGEYHPLDRSGLIDLGPAALAERIDWP
jgi:hypothetical protein